MKKLIIALVAVIASANFASAHGTKSIGNAACVATAATHCYMMKDGQMYTCDGKVLAPMRADITLANGTTVTYKGVVKTKAGAVSNLASGQCITLTGIVADYNKTHMK